MIQIRQVAYAWLSLSNFNLYGTLLALSILLSFLYFLPFVGLVTHTVKWISLFLPVFIIGILLSVYYNVRYFSKHGFFLSLYLVMVFSLLYGLSPMRFLLCLGLISLLLIDETKRRQVFEKFLTLFALILFINVLAYPLVALHLLPSLGQIEPEHWLKQEVGMYYENFAITYVTHDMFSAASSFSGLEMYRMNAWFEEPGNVGTVGALLLAATNFHMDWRGKVLIVGGVLSLSLAFFAMVFLYLGLKSPKKFIWLLVGGLVFVVVFQNNEFVSERLLSRFMSTDEGSLKADNRTGERFDLAFSQYMKSSSAWFGHDSENQLYKLHYNSSSWKNLVWDFGVVGTFIYLSIFFIILFLKYSTLSSAKFIGLLPFFIVFMVNVYQRPNLLSMSLVLIFMVAMEGGGSNGLSSKDAK